MKCVVVGSSKICNYSTLLSECSESNLIIAADGGAKHLKNIGVKPNIIVGDMDSCEPLFEFPKNAKIIKLPREKDHTDTFYAVKEGLKLGAREFLIFGGISQRLDHTYANFCIAKYLSEKGIEHKLVADDCEVFVIKHGNNKILKNIKNRVVSVFPFGSESCKVTYSGLKYKPKSGYLVSNFPLGISNIAEKDESAISVLEGYALIFVYYKF